MRRRSARSRSLTAISADEVRPAFLNTASARSAITYIDGDRGILRYRGYPIEQLAERSSYLETAYLLLFGELPTKVELARWCDEITHHTFVHENVKRWMEGYRYDAHPMGMLVSGPLGSRPSTRRPARSTTPKRGWSRSSG